ncbi:MAG: hypothetical protein AAFV95_08830 [Bacteroidota bacterium]
MKTMIVKRVLGFIFLATFIGFMTYKFADNLGGTSDDGPIIALVLAILGIVIFFVYKILREP